MTATIAQIAVFDVGSGANAELDVALSHPWVTDILSQASKNDGAAAARIEIRKTTKYCQVNIPGVSSFNFVHIVFEHFGRWEEEATNYLQELSARSTDDGGNKNPNEFKCYWQKRFSAPLQHCNAKTIARKLSRLTSTRVSNVDDFLTQFYVH